LDIKVILWIPVISAAITLVFNWIFNYLQNEMNWNIDRKKFKREHSYNQLKELYLELYPIVVQSEYVRHYFKKYLTIDFPIREYPFLEIHKTKTIFKDGEITEEEIYTAITEFNKAKIVEKVMEKPKFASQKLLKLIVAYRYVHDNYLKEQSEKLKDNFQKEELKLIYLIVLTIVRECNELPEDCNMPFDGKEISYGLMDYSVFEDSDNY
jgi:hypothetical protein